MSGREASSEASSAKADIGPISCRALRHKMSCGLGLQQPQLTDAQTGLAGVCGAARHAPGWHQESQGSDSGSGLILEVKITGRLPFSHVHRKWLGLVRVFCL